MKKLKGIFKHTFFKKKKSTIYNVHKGLLQQTATLDKKGKYVSKNLSSFCDKNQYCPQKSK